MIDPRESDAALWAKLGCTVLSLLFVIGFWCTGIYVVWHFACKFW